MDKQVVFVATYLPTGEFEVNAVVRHDGAVNTALAAYYTLAQAIKREELNALKKAQAEAEATEKAEAKAEAKPEVKAEKKVVKKVKKAKKVAKKAEVKAEAKADAPAK